MKDRFIVVIKIHRADTRACFGHNLHVVKPVEALVGPVPFGMPGEVAGVHIRSHSVAKTVQLIGADKVHLPR